MANRRIALARSLRKVRPRPAPLPAPLAEPEFDDALVEQLTGDILQHLGAANSQSVEVRAEIGRLLSKVRTDMTYGEMMELVTDRPPQDEHHKLVRDYHRAVRRLIRALDALQDEHPHIDPDDLAGPYDELELNLSQFGATFEL